MLYLITFLFSRFSESGFPTSYFTLVVVLPGCPFVTRIRGKVFWKKTVLPSLGQFFDSMKLLAHQV